MNIFDDTEELRQSYQQGVEIVDNLHFDPWEDVIKPVHYYTNSRYLGGDQDEFGRDKPFYNILNFRLNVATRATDFDTKDIQIVSDDDDDYVRSMLISHEVKKILKEGKYAKKFNDIGRTRAKFGGVLVKRVEMDDTLTLDVVDWRNVEVDPQDIMGSPIFERHMMTRRDLAEKMDSWDHVEELMTILKNDETDEIEIIEATGMFPDYEGDDTDYKPMLYILYFGSDKKQQDLVLFEEELKELPYKYLPYETIEGRSLGRGIIEDGLQAQIWTNDSIMKERDAFELGSKVVIKHRGTSLQNNLITDFDNGDVWSLNDTDDADVMNLMTNAYPEFSALQEKWDNQVERATSTFEAVTGETLPSGTPFRSVAIQNKEGNSTFAYRLEEMGIFVEEIMNDWVIPFAIKDLNKEHILASDFSIDELKVIDETFRAKAVNDKVKEILLDPERDLSQTDFDEAVKAAESLLERNGDTRFIEVPKDYFKDFEFKVSVITTGEKVNKAVALESINKMITDIANTFDPNTGSFALLEDPTLSKLFAQAIELAGIGVSPAQLGISGKERDQDVQVPQQQPVAPAPVPQDVAA